MDGVRGQQFRVVVFAPVERGSGIRQRGDLGGGEAGLVVDLEVALVILRVVVGQHDAGVGGRFVDQLGDLAALGDRVQGVRIVDGIEAQDGGVERVEVRFEVADERFGAGVLRFLGGGQKDAELGALEAQVLFRHVAHGTAGGVSAQQVVGDAGERGTDGNGPAQDEREDDEDRKDVSRILEFVLETEVQGAVVDQQHDHAEGDVQKDAQQGQEFEERGGAAGDVPFEGSVEVRFKDDAGRGFSGGFPTGKDVDIFDTLGGAAEHAESGEQGQERRDQSGQDKVGVPDREQDAEDGGGEQEDEGEGVRGDVRLLLRIEADFIDFVTELFEIAGQLFAQQEFCLAAGLTFVGVRVLHETLGGTDGVVAALADFAVIALECFAGFHSIMPPLRRSRNRRSHHRRLPSRRRPRSRDGGSGRSCRWWRLHSCR